MADRYWVGADSSWNTSGNWSATDGGAGGAGVPTSSDAVYFTGNDTTSCTCDVAISCASLSVVSGYSGKLDFADSSYSHTIAGDATFDGSGEVDMGNATITCSGNFDNKDQGTWTRGTSTLTLTGTSKTIISDTSKWVTNLNVSGTYTVDATTVTRFRAYGNVTVSGSLTLNQSFYLYGDNKAISVSGTVTGTSTFALAGIGQSFSSMTGTWSPATTLIRNNSTVNATGTFGGTWQFAPDSTAARTLTFGAGTRTFTGAVSFVDSGSSAYVIDNSTNPSFIFQSSVTFTSTGTLTWTKGSGTITFSGTNDQTITTPAGWTQRLEDIVVNKTSGRVTQARDLYTDTFDLQDGDWDLAGYTLDSAGSVTVQAGARFYDASDAVMAEGSSIVVGAGTLTLQGAA